MFWKPRIKYRVVRYDQGDYPFAILCRNVIFNKFYIGKWKMATHVTDGGFEHKDEAFKALASYIKAQRNKPKIIQVWSIAN